MKKNKPVNKTTLIVRDAMKAISKEVREPKAVREGKVKRCTAYAQSVNLPKVINLELHNIKFKEKEVLNTPRISYTINTDCIYDDSNGFPEYKGYLTRKSQLEAFDIRLNIKKTKAQKLVKVFHNTWNSKKKKPINIIVEMNHMKFSASGTIIELNTYSNGEMSFMFLPDYMNIIK